MKQRYLGNVQVLRGVAAVMVVIAHALAQFHNHPVAGMIELRDVTGIVWGNGVDIFFIISGFIMLYLADGHFAERGYPIDFLKRRIIRVVPPYWAITTLMVLAALFLAGSVNHGISSFGYVIASYLFIPVPREDGLIHPIMSLGWTLNYEFFFYSVFTIALFFKQKIAVLSLTAFFLILVAIHSFMPHGPLSFWTSPIILDFLLGIGLAALFIKGVQFPVAATIALLVIATILFVVTPIADTRNQLGALPALALTTAGILGASRQWPRPILLVGDASYALYLTHPFTLNIVTLGWRELGLPLWSVAYFLTLIVSCILVGCLAFSFAEKPLVEALRKRFEKKRQTSMYPA